MFNTVILSGRLSAPVELKQTPNGKYVTSFTIANDIGYGENKRTNWLDIVAWGKTAELITKYFAKGDLIGIKGEIQTRQYEDKNGNKRKAVEILCNEVEFLGGKKATETQAPAEAPTEQPPVFEEVPQDDDLPF